MDPKVQDSQAKLNLKQLYCKFTDNKTKTGKTLGRQNPQNRRMREMQII